MNLNDWAEEVHELARSNGWWDDADIKIVPEKLALIHSEISEALEEYRNGDIELTHTYFQLSGDTSSKPEGFGVELADAVIRIMDLAGWLGLDLDGLVEAKHRYNQSRPYRHGGKLA